MVAVGKVYLIGAGPGDPELITVRGKRLLALCEVVIYDHLVPDELLIGLRNNCEKHYVGKRAGKHTLAQDEINQLMVKLAKEGKSVARLKGGDPFIFGRGGEEASYLKEHGVPFEIVPGVTAGVAAPAFAGIPCTDRRAAQYVIFATGHKADDQNSEDVPWDKLAQAQNGTLVIYMGVKEIVNTVPKLMASGMPGTTPAAAIQRGTYPSQKVVTGTMEGLPQLIEANNIIPPVIFVIGDVVNLRPQVEWLKDKPLLGVRVMVTRAADQAQELYLKLRDLGAEVLPYPTITTTENEDSEGWRRYTCIAAAHRWLLFTSENGVRYFIKQYIERYGDIRSLSDFKIAAIGEGTAKALRNNMLRPDFVPSQATVSRLGEEFLNETQLHDAAVVRVRGDLSDNTLEDRLSEFGVDCVPITVYQTTHPIWPEGMKQKLFDYRPHAAIFTSGSTVDGLYTNLSDDEVAQLMKDCVIGSIGPATTQKLKERGLTVTIEAKVHTVDQVVAELMDYFMKKKVS
jgi:uroporphyrinogen III methyltransferase/synthase